MPAVRAALTAGRLWAVASERGMWLKGRRAARGEGERGDALCAERGRLGAEQHGGLDKETWRRLRRSRALRGDFETLNSEQRTANREREEECPRRGWDRWRAAAEFKG